MPGGGGGGGGEGGVAPQGMYSSMNSGYNMSMDGDGRSPVRPPPPLPCSYMYTTAHTPQHMHTRNLHMRS